MSGRRYTYSSNHTTSTGGSRRSADSCASRSTAPSSLYDSPRPSTKSSSTRANMAQSTCFEDEEEEDDVYDDEESDLESSSSEEEEDDMEYSDDEQAVVREDLSPSTKVYPRSAADTYSSLASSVAVEDYDEHDDNIDYDGEEEITPLPMYRHEIEEFNVRPSTPEDFAALFPSMDRLSIRHDDFTPDGNMNLRVDTAVPGRRKKVIQLFHMRMYDLNRREFSIRRYCRDSGREVCNSKRKYVDGRPAPIKFQRSMSSAMRSLSSLRRRSSAAGSIYSNASRPGTSYSKRETSEEPVEEPEQGLSVEKRGKKPQVPTNTIKLEFSNYARVDVNRHAHLGNKRYEFEWWGHKYTWKRAVDKHTDTVSFHLLRDGNSNAPVAHIVPETRSPNQVAMDEYAGGWVPPSHMWISDRSILEAMTDVADVIIATGLMALVDDCIKARWQIRKTSSRLSLTSLAAPSDAGIEPCAEVDSEAEPAAPRSLMRQLFQHRRFSDANPSPLRHQQPVAAH